MSAAMSSALHANMDALIVQLINELAPQGPSSTLLSHSTGPFSVDHTMSSDNVLPSGLNNRHDAVDYSFLNAHRRSSMPTISTTNMLDASLLRASEQPGSVLPYPLTSTQLSLLPGLAPGSQTYHSVPLSLHAAAPEVTSTCNGNWLRSLNNFAPGAIAEGGLVPISEIGREFGTRHEQPGWADLFPGADYGQMQGVDGNCEFSSSACFTGGVTDCESQTPNKKLARYKCELCEKCFTRPSALTTHTLTHTGEKPHACTYPGCNRRFSVVSNMRRHMKLHLYRPPKRGTHVVYRFCYMDQPPFSRFLRPAECSPYSMPLHHQRIAGHMNDSSLNTAPVPHGPHLPVAVDAHQPNVMSHALVPPQFPNTGDLLFSKIAPGLYPALPALPAQQPSPVPYALGSLVLDPQADGRVVSGSPITPMSCSALPTTPISCPMLSSPLMRDSGIGRLGVDSTDYYYHYRQQPLHQQQSPVTVVYMPNAVHGSGIEAKQSAAFISELMSLQTK